MDIITIFWHLLKMLYRLLYYSFRCLDLLFNNFWFLCNLASISVPWITLFTLIVYVASKFVKLKRPDDKCLHKLLTGDRKLIYPDDGAFWGIAHRAAGYDAPENSLAALEKCITRGYHNVLLDAALTACGEIVLLNSMTLEKAGLNGNICRHTLKFLKGFNISEVHPLGKPFGVQQILTIEELFDYLKKQRFTVFLYISDNSTLMMKRLKEIIKDNPIFTQCVILTSKSPILIYQLRKLYPELICGLWTEKTVSLSILKASILPSIYGVIFRNIIAPVIGISVVFVCKQEFNLQIDELWRNVGVRPIVYNVNSPSEKRYYRRIMKTQYLTDTLSSEPQPLLKD